MVSLKKSDLLTPNFDDQLDQSKKASFLKREKERLTVREGHLFNFVKHGDKSRVSLISYITKLNSLNIYRSTKVQPLLKKK